MQVATIGLDIAKNVFQVHGIDAAEKVVVRKQLRRRQVLEFFKALPPCLVGMEACATAHYGARELTKLGHQVRLMPAKDVKAYVKRSKDDAADAEATRPRGERQGFARPDCSDGQVGRASTWRASIRRIEAFLEFTEFRIILPRAGASLSKSGERA
jgi:transposase